MGVNRSCLSVYKGFAEPAEFDRQQVNGITLFLFAYLNNGKGSRYRCLCQPNPNHHK